MYTLKRYKNIIIGTVIVVLIPLAYFLFFGNRESSDTALLITPVISPKDELRSELLALLADLRTIELSEELFSDERFQRLADFSTEIVAQPVGRPNPFLPF